MTTIVLADDHPIVRQGLQALLEAEPDLRVIGEADDGLEAVTLVEHLQPDVLVLDLMMPGLSGLETARHVQKRAPRTRVVILSMHADESYVLEALEFLFCTGAYADRRIEHRPNVVLLDLKLPKVDGLEVLRRMKADPRTQMIPVVVLTTSREERDIVESYKLGVNSYIVKPVDFAQFSEAMRYLGMYWVLLNEPPRL